MRISNSIRGRLLLWLLIPLSSILVIGEFVDFNSANAPANDAYDQALVDAALATSAHLRLEHKHAYVDLPKQTDLALRTDRLDKIFISVIALDGTVLFGDGNLVPEIELTETESDPDFYDSYHNGVPIRAVVLLHHLKGGPAVIIQVAETRKKREQTASKIFWATLIPDTLNALVTILIVIIGVKIGLRPIDDISVQIQARSANDLQPIELKQTPDELKSLVIALNRLFALLTEASAAQQRFVSNAAHQLRTPLAGLQTQLELLAGDPKLTADKSKIDPLLHATGRLTHLIHQLLMLAKAKPTSALAYDLNWVDLKNLIEQNAEPFIDQALARNIDLGFELEAAKTTGNDRLIYELLTNLVDNALRYTPNGGAVTVRCGTHAESPFIEVEDNGPGIPKSERTKVFDRFYRISGSSDDGCGLGLAIVKEIADLHAAQITIADGAQQGALFRVTWAQQPSK